MPDMELVARIAAEAAGWRRALHGIPELGFDLPQTAEFVADRLAGTGCDRVERGLATSGLVAVIEGRGGEGPTIALRSDMDALPIAEATGAPHASRHPGRMHACGHDGHMAMLLGAARYLSARRGFRGRVALVFQPAEEDGGGAEVMVRAGLMERFGIGRVFGMHNLPGLPLGAVATRPGPIMAGTCEYEIAVEGRGGHPAMPHLGIDPILVGATLVLQLQTVVSRSTDPLAALALGVTQIAAGDSWNVVPDRLVIRGTIRALDPAVGAAAQARIAALCEGLGLAHGARVEPRFIPSYPPVINAAPETALAVAAARRAVDPAQVDGAAPPLLVAEDFAYMLGARPGAFVFLGTGPGPGLHTPGYDFNDAAIGAGIAYWAALVEEALGG